MGAESPIVIPDQLAVPDAMPRKMRSLPQLKHGGCGTGTR